MTWLQEPEWTIAINLIKHNDIYGTWTWLSLKHRFNLDVPFEVVQEAIVSLHRRAIDHATASHGGAWRDLGPIEVLVLVEYACDCVPTKPTFKCLLTLAGVDHPEDVLPRRPVEPNEYYQANFKPLF